MTGMTFSASMVSQLVEHFVFYASAALALAGAVGTVASKNAIRAAVALLITIFGIAGLYMTLMAQLLAAIQVLVYAGAVVVLFVFVIMLLGGQGDVRRDQRSVVSRTVAVAGIGIGAVLTLAVLAHVGLGGLRRAAMAPVEFGSVSALGKLVLTDGLIPVELVGVLLTVAIVGVMAVARVRRTPRCADISPTGVQGASDATPRETKAVPS